MTGLTEFDDDAIAAAVDLVGRTGAREPDGEHNALADARHNLVRAHALGVL